MEENPKGLTPHQRNLQPEGQSEREREREIQINSDQKLDPCGTDGRLLLRAKFFQLQSHVTQKTRIYQKSGQNKFRYCPLVKESAVTCQLPRKMADEMGLDFKNGRISHFQRHVALTLDQAMWHTVVHHSSTSTYTPNFI